MTRVLSITGSDGGAVQDAYEVEGDSIAVIASKPGHYGHVRAEGDEFVYPVASPYMKRDIKRDADGAPIRRKDIAGNDIPGTTVADPKGDFVLPSWMVPATPEERTRLAQERKGANQRAKEAAMASAGPKKIGKKGGFAVAPGAEDLV